MSKARVSTVAITMMAVLGILIALHPAGVFQAEKRDTAPLTVVSSLKDTGPFDAAIQAADMVVFGEVRSLGTPVSNEPTSPGQSMAERGLHTPVVLQVSQVFKGDCKPGEVITFAQLGGRSGGQAVVFPGEAVFAVGDQVLVPLYKPTGAFIVWTGGKLYADQGMYLIAPDRTASNRVRGETFTLDSLMNKVRRAIGTH